MNTSDYTIEISKDNQNWTEVVNVKKINWGKPKILSNRQKRGTLESQPLNQHKEQIPLFVYMKYKY